VIAPVDPNGSDGGDGPDVGQLRALHGMLPSFAKGIVEKKTLGKGNKVHAVKPKVPRKICKVCALAFDHVEGTEPLPLTPSKCEKCDAMLKQGYIAFISGDRYIFAKSKAMADQAGEILKISEPVFEKLAKQFEVTASQKEKNGEEKDPPGKG
jgi:hypothetical protein